MQENNQQGIETKAQKKTKEKLNHYRPILVPRFSRDPICFSFFFEAFDSFLPILKMYTAVVAILLALGANAQFNATFQPVFNVQGSGLALNNSANNVTDLSATGFNAGQQLAGLFISSAENFTAGGVASNTALFNTAGASTNFGVDLAAANFGGSVANSTAATASRTAASDNVGYATGQAGVTQSATGVSVFNTLTGLSSQAGFSAGTPTVGVAAGATFLGGSDVGGLKPSQGIGAITGALANPTGTAAACSGSSQSSFLYGAGQTNTGCSVQSAIGLVN
eukprot:TRINITY_DN1195_c0_g1_i2.p1 TRINITY_DN1195_c0_g1~~TRINITY_DN1195_c0_g1_i2.p1  ORF type:complete len:280 (+),score=47.59 TRINITY_DN1195_c0_g1_i2:213-1052(+)